MKKSFFLGTLVAAFCLSQGFVSKSAEKTDWLIEVTASGISVIDDGKNCIDVTVNVADFHASFSNCPKP
jgi:hypothetical protein